MTGRLDRALRRLGKDDRGALAPAVAILLVPLFVLTGLVVDGSRFLDARSTAQAYAEEAARAGAAQVNVAVPDLALKTDGSVQQAVADYCTTILSNSTNSNTSNLTVTGCVFAGITDTALGNPLVVHVQVTVTMKTWLLDLIEVNSFTTTVDASAKPEEGITGPQPN